MENSDSQKKYHNTQLLLQHYRYAAWSLEMEMTQVCESYPMNYGEPFAERLASMEDIGVSYYGDSLKRHTANMRQTWQMIQLINHSVQTIRTKHPKGELFYQVLHHSYLASDGPYSISQIIHLLEQDGFYMSPRTYYRHRREAVSLLSSVLWGYTSNECQTVLEECLRQLSQKQLQ